MEFSNDVKGLSSDITDTHKDHKQMVCCPSKDISTLLSSMSTFTAKVHGSNQEHQKKKRKRDSGMESIVGAMHDYNKLSIAVEMVECHKGTHVFPRFPFGYY